jgi:hypothetical protein
MGEATRDKIARTYLLTPESVGLLEQMASADNRTYSSEVEWLIKAEHKRRNGSAAAVLADGDGQEAADVA